MATLPLNLPILFRGNEYLSAISIETNPIPNLVGTPIRKSDIGHEVYPGRLGSLSRVAGYAGFLVFYSRS